MNTSFDHIVPVIILNWNGLEDTIECLDSVFKSSIKNFKIFLLDNGSKPNDVDQLKKRYSGNDQIELIFSEENLGFAKGNNFVYEYLLRSEVNFEYLVLLNNDTVVESNWLEELLDISKRRKADVVSSKMVNYFDRSIMDNAGHKMLNTAEVVPVSFRVPIEEANEELENFGACAGACLYRKTMLDDIGLFDPYFSTGYEDAEFGVRATVAGYKCLYAPKAIIYHKISQSVSKIFDYNYLLSIQTNIFYTYFKLMPLGVILISIPSFIFKYLSIVIVDVLFWRPKYLKIQYDALKRILLNEWPIIKRERRIFFEKVKPISSLSILLKQDFFLWFDIKRFFKYVVFKKKSEFDKVI